ncbi:MAG: hypothetical protein LBU32_00855 [Clostridiales bacterium]|nr:hypothetical protein [Clostridiales bacterium]
MRARWRGGEQRKVRRRRESPVCNGWNAGKPRKDCIPGESLEQASSEWNARFANCELHSEKSNGFYSGPITQRKPREIYAWIYENSGEFSVVRHCMCGGRDIIIASAAQVDKSVTPDWYRP